MYFGLPKTVNVIFLRQLWAIYTRDPNWLRVARQTAGSSSIIPSSTHHPSPANLTRTWKAVFSLAIPWEKSPALILRSVVIQSWLACQPVYFHLPDLRQICKSNAWPKSRWPGSPRLHQRKATRANLKIELRLIRSSDPIGTTRKEV